MVLDASYRNLFNSNDKSFSFIFHDNIDYLRGLFDSGKMRSVTYDNIQQTILCSTPALGFDIFECPTCNSSSYVPHTCKSRFCTKCGCKSSKQRSAFVSSMALDSPHRHIVFTIPKELIEFFIKDRNLLHLLFIASRNTLTNVFNNAKFSKAKKNNTLNNNTSNYLFKDSHNLISFGAVASLHTFGRDLKWNPHIHILVSEDAYDSKKDAIKNFSFISFQKLRHTWMFEILNLLHNHFGDSFRELKNQLYTTYTDGFYVYAPKVKEDMEEEDIHNTVSYITRYSSRPAMAQSRIVSYDPSSKQIHWFYHDHETEERVDVKEHVHDFLNKLILHCPEKHFKMVRYYGFYSNKGRNTLDRMYELQGKKKKQKVKSWKERKEIIECIKKIRFAFRHHLLMTFNVDPFLCECGTFMDYVYSYNPRKGGGRNGRKKRDQSIREMDEERGIIRGGNQTAPGWT